MPLFQPSLSGKAEEPEFLSSAEKVRVKVDHLLHGLSDPLRQGPHLTRELALLTKGNEVEQELEDIDELRAMGARLRNPHNDLTREIAEASGGRHRLPRKLKREERMWDKYVEHGFTHKKTGDIVRSSIHFDDLRTLYRAVVELYKRAEIVRVKDRFIEPRKSGYRDLLFNVRLRDPETGKGFITEIQFQLESMYRAKAEEYPLYKKRRALVQELAYSKKHEPGGTEKIKHLEMEIAHLENDSLRIFEEAWSPYTGVLDNTLSDAA